jgi:hypothetical protein
MNIEGTVVKVEETETFGTFSKRAIWVDTADQYRNQLTVDFVQDKVSLLDAVNVGDKVDIAINIQGNEHNGKRYVGLQGWKITAESAASAPTTADDDPFA